MEYREFKAKTVDEAITLASTEFGCASTELDYEVIEDSLESVQSRQSLRQRKRKAF